MLHMRPLLCKLHLFPGFTLRGVPGERGFHGAIKSLTFHLCDLRLILEIFLSRSAHCNEQEIYQVNSFTSFFKDFFHLISNLEQKLKYK